MMSSSRCRPRRARCLRSKGLKTRGTVTSPSSGRAGSSSSIGSPRRATGKSRSCAITLPHRPSGYLRGFCRLGIEVLRSKEIFDFMGRRLPSGLGELALQEFSKILLIKLSAVGDVVHTIPVLNKLRRRYPAAQIDWLVTTPIAALLRHHPGIHHGIQLAREEWQSPWRLTPFANYARLAASLRATGYDLVVDMHGQLRTALLTLATGATVRVGFDRPRSEVWSASDREFPPLARKHAWQGAREGSWLAYTHHIPVPTLDVHAVDRYLNVGPILGLDDGAADFSFPIPAAASARIEQLLRGHGIA